MQRRASKRIPAKVAVRFYCDNNEYIGNVTDLSRDGMFISTDNMCFPFSSEFKVAFPIETEVLNIHVLVRRITKTKDCYDGIGVKILNPPKNYLEYIESICSNL